MSNVKTVTLANILKKDQIGIKRYSTIPVSVEAVTFGGWSNAALIHSWTNGALYVPEGYEHVLRIPDEYDQNGKLLVSASEFLVLKDASGMGTPEGETRVDVGNWIVKSVDDNIHVYSDEVFKQYYAEQMY